MKIVGIGERRVFKNGAWVIDPDAAPISAEREAEAAVEIDRTLSAEQFELPVVLLEDEAP
jgi:hypothetical protein